MKSKKQSTIYAKKIFVVIKIKIKPEIIVITPENLEDLLIANAI